MTLFHLLLGIALVTPIFSAARVGARFGFWGGVLGSIAGFGIGLFSAYGCWRGIFVIKWLTDRTKSEALQSVTILLFYVGTILWDFLVAAVIERWPVR